MTLISPADVSDHFDGQRFFNPTGSNGQSFWQLPRLFLTKRTPWPKQVPVEPRRPPQPVGSGEVIVTFIGHATFLIQTATGNLLTDPMYSERASPLRFAGPRRVAAPGVPFKDLPQIDLVLLSHNHYDHCDLPTLRALSRRFRPRLITPLGNRRLLRSAGIARVEELDWWQQAVSASPHVTLVPAQHFSARGPLDRNRALWGGFIIEAGRTRIFFAGDSGYAGHFGEIRERFAPIDLALLPIGAYEPRWFMRDVHMNPAEAVQAHLDLDAARSIGMHFGTFQLTAEGISDPVDELDRALQEQDVPSSQFEVLEFGESLRIGQSALDLERSKFGIVGP
jgi:L-ascorbate metabolism protein UlaG (beta-lactamase superfamily)